MMILDKKSSLITLFNLGAELKTIKSIFFVHGSLLTFLSGLVGLFLGIMVVLLQQQFNIVMLTPNLPYPVRLIPINVLVVLVTIFLLGLFASQIASRRINFELLTNQQLG